MKCLFIASEVTGFAKTGGLADVAASLPRALAQRGLDCAVMMPLYASVRKVSLPIEDTGLKVQVPIGGWPIEGGIWRGRLPDSQVPVYLIDNAEYFGRDDASSAGLYQQTDAQGHRTDYPDNATRFGFFSRAVLDALPRLDFWPDIVHANDWQTGLAPVFLREFYRRHPKSQFRARYQKIRTLFTIHNLAFQGTFGEPDLDALGLPAHLFTPELLEFFGQVNFLKAGIVFSDLITTVSPTYAREIQTHYYGCGLQGVLTQRSSKLSGIVNGVDYGSWDPATDRNLAARYDVSTLDDGKVRCKVALLNEFGLEAHPRTPVLGVVSRLSEQKGIELIVKALPSHLRQGVHLVVLGDGERRYHEMLEHLRDQFPSQVGVRFGFSETVAHQIEAGADVFLMPSQYEPCGLNQLYSLKYGTVPLVRATGGLNDTVVDATQENLANGRATGFVFVPFSPKAFAETLDRCLRLYRDDPLRWRQVQRTGMAQDWSWDRSAAEYEKLYRSAVEAL